MKVLTRSAAAGVSKMAIGILLMKCRQQCIFDDQQPAKFLGRNFEFPGPVSGLSQKRGIGPRAFENLT